MKIRKYVLRVFGEICSPYYDTPEEAVEAILLLKEEHQSIAEVDDVEVNVDIN